MASYFDGIHTINNNFQNGYIQCTVRMKPDANGETTFYSRIFGNDRDRDSILANEIAGGDYLSWPSQTVRITELPEPHPAPDA